MPLLQKLNCPRAGARRQFSIANRAGYANIR